MNSMKNNIWRGLFALLLGLVMVSFPEIVERYLVLVVGITFMIFGAVSLGMYISKRSNGQRSVAIPIEGSVGLILGIALVIAPGFFLAITMILLGVILVTAGVIQFAGLISVQRSKVKLPFWAYLLPVAVVATGLIVIFNPFTTPRALMIFFGAAAMFCGFSAIFDTMFLRAYLKDR